MKISVGPIPYSWDKDSIIRFYEEIKNTQADDIYIGEVICSKRKGLSVSEILLLTKDLESAGKRVFLSTLGLITNQREIRWTEELCQLPYPIEVNNIGVLKILNQKIKESVIGIYIPIYNRPSAIFFKRLGLRRMVLLPELSKEAIGSIIDRVEIEREILGFGRLSLGLSWRCYTSLSAHSSKNISSCSECYSLKEGIPIETIDNKNIYTLNGTQILSGYIFCLLEHIEILKAMGINNIRIQPQWRGTKDIIDIAYGLISKEVTTRDAILELRKISEASLCNGWFFGKAGWDYIGDVKASA